MDISKCDEIYGVDTSKEITPIMVRDAIVKCYYQAHQQVLGDMKNYMDFKSEDEFERFKKLNVKSLIKTKFDEVGGDFNNPTKDSLIKVVYALKDFAKFYRDLETIEKHANEIMYLIEQINS